MVLGFQEFLYMLSAFGNSDMFRKKGFVKQMQTLSL